MRLLITGASGFIGQSLIRTASANTSLRLLQHQTQLKRQAEVVQGNLENPQDCLRICEGVDCIVHAAGGTGSAAVGAQAAMAGIVHNLVLTARLLEAAWAKKVSKILIFGSTTGYPERERALVESDMHQGPPPPAYQGYGWMRRYLEHLGEYVSSQSATKIIVLRPTAVYGPGDQSSHVIPSLFAKAAQKADPFEIWGSGTEERDFLYVDDLTAACHRALEKLEPGQPIHLASGETTTIAQLSHLILQISGHQPAQIHYRSDRPTNIRARQFDLSLAQKTLDFRPQVSLRSGLERTWAWLQKSDNPASRE